MKIIYFLIFFLMSCNANGKEKNELNILIDSLGSAEFKKEYMRDEIRALIKQLKDTGGEKVIGAFYNFALSNKQYGDMVFNALFNLHPADISTWIRNNKGSFTINQWETIFRNYEIDAYKWNDSILANTLIDIASNTKDENVMYFALLTYASSGTYQEVKKVVFPIVKITVDKHSRMQIFKALCRYSEPVIKNEIINFLTNYSEPEVINYCLESGLQEYSRHDFLPELYALKTKLTKVKDVTKVAEAKETLEILKTVIPYLEQKKAENAPIGLPLNWPEGNAQK